MKATTILVIAFTISVYSSELVGLYVEHNALDKNPDFVHLHLAPKETREIGSANSNGISKPKLVFRLPTKLSHDDTFELRICKPGTAAAASSGENPDLTENCVSDQFNSILGLNYDTELPLYQVAYNNFVKTCFFGVAIFEAEHSYNKMSLDDLYQGKTSTDSSLYYKEATEVVEKYEDSKAYNMRMYQNTQDDIRCTLDLDTTENLQESAFTGDLFYQKNSGKLSVLILDYNFQGEQFRNENHVSKTMQFPEPDYNDMEKKRQQIVNKMKKALVFETSTFEDRKLTFSVQNGKQDGIPILTVNAGGDHTSVHQLPFLIEKKSYLRFIPVVCRELLSTQGELSYMFLDSNECDTVSKNKFVITDLGKGFNFLYLDGQKAVSKPSLDLNYFAMNFHYYPKDEPLEVIKLKGFEKRCDIIFDEDKSVVYYVCYQKIREFFNEKEKPINEEDLQNKIIKIVNNGDNKVHKRLLSVNGKAAKFLLIVIVVCAFVAVLSVFFWSMQILTIVMLFVIVLCVIGIFMTGSDDRILASTNDGKVEVAYKRSFSAFLNKRQMRMEKARIERMNEVSPNLFTKYTPQGECVIADIDTISSEMFKADKALGEKAKILLSKGTNKQASKNNLTEDESLDNSLSNFNLEAIKQAQAQKDLRIEQARQGKIMARSVDNVRKRLVV